MRSKHFFCLFLFVSVLCVSHCTVSVGAYDSNEVIPEIKTAPKKEMAKYAGTVGNKLEDYFQKLNENVTEASNLMELTERSVRRATNKLLKGMSKLANDMLNKMKLFVWVAGRFLHRLKQLNGEISKYKKLKIKEIMSECVEKNESLNAVMKDATGNVGNKKSAGAKRAKEIYKKAVMCTGLWEHMHQRINEQSSAALSVVLYLNKANKTKEEIINFLKRHADTFDEVITALEIGVHNNLTTLLNRSEEITKASEEALEYAAEEVKLRKQFQEKAEELLQTLTAAQKKRIYYGGDGKKKITQKTAPSPSFLLENAPVTRPQTTPLSQSQEVTYTIVGESDAADHETVKYFAHNKEQLIAGDERDDKNAQPNPSDPSAESSLEENQIDAYVLNYYTKSEYENGMAGRTRGDTFAVEGSDSETEEMTGDEQLAEASSTSQDTGDSDDVQEEASVLETANKTPLLGRTNALRTLLQPKGADGAVRSCLALLPSLCLWCFLTALHCCQATAA